MGDPFEYPNPWARLVDEACRRPGWNKTRFAKSAGVDRRTVTRWISGESTQITTRSMVLVAEATGQEYEAVARAVLGAQAVDHVKDDEAIKMIRADPDVDESLKRGLIEMVVERRVENEAALMREVQLLLRSGRREAI